MLSCFFFTRGHDKKLGNRLMIGSATSLAWSPSSHPQASPSWPPGPSSRCVGARWTLQSCRRCFGRWPRASHPPPLVRGHPKCLGHLQAGSSFFLSFFCFCFVPCLFSFHRDDLDFCSSEGTCSLAGVCGGWSFFGFVFSAGGNPSFWMGFSRQCSVWCLADRYYTCTPHTGTGNTHCNTETRCVWYCMCLS